MHEARLEQPPQPDRELKALRNLTRRLPPVRRISGVVNRAIKPWYLRRERVEVVAPVFDFRMRLIPKEAVDGACLFYPQLYDRHEISRLRTVLRAGDVFVDAGAHIGFYSLIAAGVVGRAGRVIAIEAEEYNFARLVWNAEENGFSQIRAVRRGIATEAGTRSFGAVTTGNRGGSSFSASSEQTQLVECAPLLDILREEGIESVTAMKLDIEGGELGVLAQFFSDAPEGLWPSVLVAEDEDSLRNPEDVRSGGSLGDLMRANGYSLESSHAGNALNRVFSRDE